MGVKIKLYIRRLDNRLPMPKRHSKEASGIDIYSRIDAVLMPLSWIVIPTGISVKLPKGYEMQIRPRSGIAAKDGIGILNSPGTIDADYRGEIKVIMFNISKKPWKIKRGERVAQAVVSPVILPEIVEVEKLNNTARGDKGFGSTGNK